ncbi:MAG: Holliday junction resolvasome DNA-binding subunit [Chlorobi bacterium OLB5]|nr:MAG: Holliday junction resolvasome DNA-binding subunit [Chlorobi bacterium OLB5]
MIDYIKGKLVSKKTAGMVIEAGGIGYSINATLGTIENTGETGSETMIPVHLHIKDNPFAVMLYGFRDENERECFRQIISVSGIGPKTALSILSAINYNELIEMIAKGNYHPLTTISGVGKKTAERLAVELKDKIGKIESDVTSSSVNTGKFGELGKASEVIQALMALGYNRIEADKMVKTISSRSDFMDMPVETIVREILRGK